jgi:transporter family protein
MEPWVIYGLLSATGAALVAIFGKIGVSHVDSTVATAVRAIIMALAMVGAVFVFGKARMVQAIDGKALLFIVLAGLAGAASWYWYFLALKTGPVTGVVALDRLSIVFAVVLAALFLGEVPTWLHGAGLVLMVAGAFLLIH